MLPVHKLDVTIAHEHSAQAKGPLLGPLADVEGLGDAKKIFNLNK